MICFWINHSTWEPYPGVVIIIVNIYIELQCSTILSSVGAFQLMRDVFHNLSYILECCTWITWIFFPVLLLTSLRSLYHLPVLWAETRNHDAFVMRKWLIIAMHGLRNCMQSMTDAINMSCPCPYPTVFEDPFLRYTINSFRPSDAYMRW